MRITIPSPVKSILKELADHGFQAYIVGGSVRDSLLQKTPGDYDITTSATPAEVKAIFHPTIDTGIAHGTVTVLRNHVGYEVTTFRVDGNYIDSRHPSEVQFTPNLREDLLRRDFTINAMAYNEQGLVDLYGGMEDLQNRLIRCVGNPEERFAEDALRIMRCVRFSAQLDFSIEEKTYAAAKKLAPNLAHISAERIHDELVKTLSSDHPEKIDLFAEIGAFQVFYPAFYPYREQILSLLKKLPNDFLLRLTAFFFVGETAAERVENASRLLEQLRFDNHTKNQVLHLLTFSDREPICDLYGCRVWLHDFGKENTDDYFDFLTAWKNNPAYREQQKICQKMIDEAVPTSLKELAVGGRDLLNLGIKPGRELGDLLEQLLGEVLKDPAKNERELLLAEASIFLQKAGKRVII